MRKFLLKGSLFSLPLVVLFISVFFVDPYYLYHKHRPFSQELYDIDCSFDQGRRFKIITYLNNPDPYIILGASEINVLHERNIPEEGWHSLSFGGAPLEESLDLFWRIVNENKIKRLIIAPEFIKYYNDCLGDYYIWNASHSARAYELFSNKLEYFIDKNVIRSTFFAVTSSFGYSSSLNKPKMTKDEFWKHQLDYAIRQYSQHLTKKQIDNVKSRLTDVSKYCLEHHIDVKVVLPIQHLDLIALEYSEEVYPIYRDYLSFLIREFGIVYYFDFPNEISSKKELFSDPFHYLKSDIYISSIWENDSTNCYILRNVRDIEKIDLLRMKFYKHE